jgi:hypothetical protein
MVTTIASASSGRDEFGTDMSGLIMCRRGRPCAKPSASA